MYKTAFISVFDHVGTLEALEIHVAYQIWTF